MFPLINRRFQLALLAGTALTLAAPGAKLAHAAVDTYDGPGSSTNNGNFNLGSNYDTGTAPGANDTAIFNDYGILGDRSITFANTANPLSTLSLEGDEYAIYTFTIASGQTFTPTTVIASVIDNEFFVNNGTLTIGALNSTTDNNRIYFQNLAPTIGSFTDSAGINLYFTQITSGTINIGSIAGTNSGSVINLNTAALSFGSNNATTSYAGGIYDDNGNAANVTKVGTGTTTVTGGIYLYGGGALNVNAGGLVIGGGQANLVTVASGATLSLTTGTILSASGIAGAGTIDLAAGSVLTSGNVANTVAATTFSGLISGAGALRVQSDDNGNHQVLTLTHANTFTGGVSITSGSTILVNNDAALGTGTLITGGAATLGVAPGTSAVTINNPGSLSSSSTSNLDAGTGQTLTYTGIISGGPNSILNKSGAGLVVLDGINNYSGITTVAVGTLEIGDAAHSTASVATDVSISSGATLEGHGTVNGSIYNIAGGTVHPGGSIGMLTTTGNYSQDASSTFAVEVSPTAASLLTVGGTASLAGTLAITADAGNYTHGTSYTILSSTGARTGTFGTVTETGQAVQFSEVYTANAVNLTVLADSTAPVMSMPTTNPITHVFFDIGPETPNEANALGAIEAALPTATGAFATGLTQLGLATGQNSVPLAGTLGELRANLGTVDLANLTSYQNFLVERMDRRQGLTSTSEVNNGLPGTFEVAQNGSSDMPLFGPNGVIETDAPSVWAHGYGVLGSAGGETGFNEVEYQTGGIVAGVDAMVTDTTLAGAAIAYEHTDLNLTGNESENSNTIETYRLSLYGSQKLDQWNVPLVLDAAFGYSYNQYQNSDFLPTATTGITQDSKHDGNELTAELGASHSFDVKQDVVSGALKIVPRVGVEYDNISQDAYANTGAVAPGLNLATSGSTLNALRSTVGARADLKLKTDRGMVITPEVRAAYLHDFADTNVALTEAFTGSGGNAFRVAGVHPGRDAALVGTGVTVGFSDSLSASIGYDADVRQHELDHTVQVGIKSTW